MLLTLSFQKFFLIIFYVSKIYLNFVRVESLEWEEMLCLEAAMCSIEIIIIVIYCCYIIMRNSSLTCGYYFPPYLFKILKYYSKFLTLWSFFGSYWAKGKLAQLYFYKKKTTELVLLFHKKTTKLVFLWPKMSQRNFQVLSNSRLMCSKMEHAC